MKEFLFDCSIVAAIRVTAQTEAEARKMLAEALDGADANFGCWPNNGDPINAEASIMGANLVEVDGEAT